MRSRPDPIAGEVTKVDFHGGRVTLRSSDGRVREFEASAETLENVNVGDRIEAPPAGEPRGNPVSISGKTDQAKGRMKQATGVLTGDKRLEREGKLDRVTGSIKDTTQKLTDDIKKKTGSVVDKVKSIAKRQPAR